MRRRLHMVLCECCLCPFSAKLCTSRFASSLILFIYCCILANFVLETGTGELSEPLLVRD